MSVRAFEIGTLAMVRTRVHFARSHSAIVDIPSLKYGDMPVEIALADLFAPADSDAAALAAAELVGRADGLLALAQRLQAEIYELGGHAAVNRLSKSPGLTFGKSGGIVPCVETPNPGG